MSHTKNIMCGIPQENILGPTLFIAYRNDLLYASLNGKIYSYVDDTSFVYGGTNEVDILYQTIRHILTLNIREMNYNMLWKKVTDVTHKIKIGNEELAPA